MDKKAILQLKKITNLGIAKCHQALLKAKGDVDKAIQILREENKKLGAKKIGKEMPQGRLFVLLNEGKTVGVMIGLGCETDFVAKNANFKQIGRDMAKASLKHHLPTKEALLASSYKKSTFQEELLLLVGQMKENIALTHYEIMEGNLLGVYVHTGETLGAMVAMNLTQCPNYNMEQLAQEMAMQVVVSNPLAIHEKDLPADVLQSEKKVIEARIAQEGKPAHIVEKIVAGQMNKFIREQTLAYQPCINDENQLVGAYLKNIDPTITITNFKRITVIQ